MPGVYESGEAMQFENRVCVVTGGASGIGAASAKEFARRGARVVVTDINAEGCEQVASEIGGIAIPCDVASESSVNDLVNQTEAKLGPIDLFFNNAGVATGADPLTTPVDVWQDQWQINVMAHVYAIRAVLPGMLARGEGYLVHTASMEFKNRACMNLIKMNRSFKSGHSILQRSFKSESWIHHILTS